MLLDAILYATVFVDWQSRRQGERRNFSPPPEIGKFVVEIWSYLLEVYTFREEADVQEICSRKL